MTHVVDFVSPLLEEHHHRTQSPGEAAPLGNEQVFPNYLSGGGGAEAGVHH
ncbi:hypothetical protein E2C01_074208 [Portunus trituberculatus]|uniref:Uncharacterized protein n=1 Tax=Portunus trituberculatus TaxID=210409 RepID=A0A5B7I2S9_PORTR|nr:hypothetical protein [Portunus trituberculatus]